MHVVDGSLLEPLHVQSARTLSALQVTDDEVANDGRELTLLALFIIEVNGDDCAPDLADHDVAKIEIFQEAAAHGVVLHAESVIKIRAVHLTVLGEDVLHAARYFASDSNAAVPVLHAATAHDEIFRRHIDPTAISVAPRLDGDAVVARVELAILYQHIRAGLRVAAVIVRAVTLDFHSAHGDVRRKHWVNLPHRGVDDMNVFDEDILAAIGLNKVGAQVFTLPEDALADRNIALAVIQQFAYAGSRRSFAPTGPAPVPSPPVLIGRRAVECSFARYA